MSRLSYTRAMKAAMAPHKPKRGTTFRGKNRAGIKVKGSPKGTLSRSQMERIVLRHGDYRKIAK